MLTNTLPVSTSMTGPNLTDTPKYVNSASIIFSPSTKFDSQISSNLFHAEYSNVIENPSSSFKLNTPTKIKVLKKDELSNYSFNESSVYYPNVVLSSESNLNGAESSKLYSVCAPALNSSNYTTTKYTIPQDYQSSDLNYLPTNKDGLRTNFSKVNVMRTPMPIIISTGKTNNLLTNSSKCIPISHSTSSYSPFNESTIYVKNNAESKISDFDLSSSDFINKKSENSNLAWTSNQMYTSPVKVTPNYSNNEIRLPPSHFNTSSPRHLVTSSDPITFPIAFNDDFVVNSQVFDDLNLKKNVDMNIKAKAIQPSLPYISSAVSGSLNLKNSNLADNIIIQENSFSKADAFIDKPKLQNIVNSPGHISINKFSANRNLTFSSDHIIKNEIKHSLNNSNSSDSSHNFSYDNENSLTHNSTKELLFPAQKVISNESNSTNVFRQMNSPQHFTNDYISALASPRHRSVENNISFLNGEKSVYSPHHNVSNDSSVGVRASFTAFSEQFKPNDDYFSAAGGNKNIGSPHHCNLSQFSKTSVNNTLIPITMTFSTNFSNTTDLIDTPTHTISAATQNSIISPPIKAFNATYLPPTNTDNVKSPRHFSLYKSSTPAPGDLNAIASPQQTKINDSFKPTNNGDNVNSPRHFSLYKSSTPSATSGSQVTSPRQSPFNDNFSSPKDSAKSTPHFTFGKDMNGQSSVASGGRKKPTFILPPNKTAKESRESEEIDRKYEEIMKLSGRLLIDGKRQIVNINEMESLSELGHGTCGYVIQMKHLPTNTMMAVKQMRRSGSYEENKRIIMDLDVVMKCHTCPNIVQCIGTFITQTDVWICMELMSTCLDKLMKEYKTPIPEKILGKIAVSTVDALNYLKENHEVIHRDVKPSNILLDNEGRIKLCDFGISGRLVDSKAKTRSAGCTAYMAPERIDPPDPTQPDYDIRADVWSLGLTLVELATCEFPYKNCGTDFELLSKILMDQAPRLPANRGFSMDFSSFIAQCLTKDYRNRPKYQELFKHNFIVRYNGLFVDVKSWYSKLKEKD